MSSSITSGSRSQILHSSPVPLRPSTGDETFHQLCPWSLVPGFFTVNLCWASRPVRWEANSIPLTWREQLSGQDLSSFMDLYSGGRQLQIFQPAVYRCFVQQELIAQFNPIASVDLLGAESQSKRPGQRQFGKADPVLRGLQLVLLMVSVLVVGGLLCKVVFRPIQGKKNQVLLVK
ncbi:protein FAM187B isoform X3 [Peromyscus maniculatus bairdii]|uniref:protein FAM187B isoform X3 n=1 Tax=Peromyscus maniculatus bairdii TaxID=230844 RepID=UPI001C2EE972|nr:protein FAM187B isoform X3 [Peromyscus maniculatus bairdii]